MLRDAGGVVLEYLSGRQYARVDRHIIQSARQEAAAIAGAETKRRRAVSGHDTVGLVQRSSRRRTQPVHAILVDVDTGRRIRPRVPRLLARDAMDPLTRHHGVLKIGP